jgi:pyruvate carboxylase
LTPAARRSGEEKAAVRKIRKLLVANRGEIAVRIFRAATELNIKTVAIYTVADRKSLHVTKADEAYLVGDESNPIRAYLDIDEIVDVAKECGADAIHPGYGFLSENADFARAADAAGVLFLGPPPSALEAMGDKVKARERAVACGLPVIPGSPPVASEDEAAAQAAKIGYPVLIKASHGGGGRGMRVARSEEETRNFFSEAVRESEQAFGDGEVFIEKYLDKPKHVEVQILADSFGNTFHLFERDCSVQRRHQKVIEVAPAVNLDPALRARMCDDAVKLAKSIGYVSAGTVEFLVAGGEHYFIEMNPRIQVEHTVTEEITGVDLVKAQIRVGEGRSLPDLGIAEQAKIATRGYAIQFRITTEDPLNNFAPDFGRITVYRNAAGPGIRLDAGNAFSGAVVSPHYDSLLVKLTSKATSFDRTCAQAARALAEFRIRGVKTNIPFLMNVLKHPKFVSGDCHTRFIEETPELLEFEPPRNRASRILAYLADVSVNGSAMIPATHEARRRTFATPTAPKVRRADARPPGTRDILRDLGPEGFAKWTFEQKRLLVTDTTLRDAHQSLLATRLRTFDMLAVAPWYATRAAGLYSLEMWGGATFDVCYRFLRENPWKRLVNLREKIPNICFQMLLRGSNGVGYSAYPDNVVRAFVKESADSGIDVFRVFDALNWTEQMQTAIDAVLKAGKVAEGTVCYTGDLLDPAEDKFTRDYYVRIAKDLKKRGAHLLAIKDMAGLLKPHAAFDLVRVLRDATGIPIHLHTHDTAGIQAATVLKASDAGLDVVDLAVGSMSGLTSQPNLESCVEMLRGTERATALDPDDFHPLSRYFEALRKIYAPFESGLLSGSAEVYRHEMPGGQYANLFVQATSLGVADRWKTIKEVYRKVDRLFGRIPKVTPSSKVVGDLALYLVANGLSTDDVLSRAKELDLPKSVDDLLSGRLGRPEGGWPAELLRAVKGDAPQSNERPGASMKPVDWDAVNADLSKRYDRPIKTYEAISYAMYPQIVVDYLEHRARFADVSLIPTQPFLYGMKPGDETEVEIERGKKLLIKLLAISDLDPDNGQREVFFELNGIPRTAKVVDQAAGKKERRNKRADKSDADQVGAPMSGTLVRYLVKPGDAVKRGQKLCVIEAMKMESAVTAPRDAKVASCDVGEKAAIQVGDLLLTLG